MEADGIHITDAPEAGNVELDAAQNIEINVGNNGIDNSGAVTVDIKAKGEVKIDAGIGQTSAEGDGARLEGSGSIAISGNNTNIKGHDEGLYIHEKTTSQEGIKVTASGADENGFGNIIAGNDNGIESAGTAGIDVSAVNGSNRIFGVNSAILNSGSGTIMITAGQRPDESSISLLANYEGIDNLIGVADDGTYSVNGIESDGTGLTDVYASHDNTIFGTENGILSSDAGTIKVEAENDNIIGQYSNGTINLSKIGIRVNSGSVSLSAGSSNKIIGSSVGVHSNGTTTITAQYNNEITGGDFLLGKGSGVNSTEGSIIISSLYGNNIIKGAFGGVITNPGASIINIEAYCQNNIDGNLANGVYGAGNAKIYLNAAQNNIYGYNGINSENSSNIEITAVNNDSLLEKNNYIQTTSIGIWSHSSSTVKVNALYGENKITSDKYGIYSQKSSSVNLKAINNIISSLGASSNGLYASTKANIYLKAQENNTVRSTQRGIYSYGSLIDLQAGASNEIYAGTYGVLSYDSSISITANITNHIYGSDYGIYALTYAPTTYSLNKIILDGENNSVTSDYVGICVDSSKGFYSDGSGTVVSLIADTNNVIRGGEVNTVNNINFANNYAVKALIGSTVTLEAGNANKLLGAVYANGTDTDVFIGNKDNSASKLNEVYSNAYIGGAGDLSDQKVISALYAEEGAEISLVGDNNILRTYAVSSSDDLERVVWAYKGDADEGAKINITGQVYISTDSYADSVYETGSSNSKDIAVVSGTASGLEKLSSEEIKNYSGDRAEVNIDYTGSSYISGDILSAYAGETTIQSQGGNSKLDIEGSLLAGNNGIVNVDLGNGGILTGRADDYGDAGVIDGSGHGTSFFNPAFSSEIKSGGEVNLTMGEGSRWNVTGQSWITRINTENSSNVVIDLVSANTDRNTNAHALTVYELTGNAEFHMSLDADRNVSDMLYIKNADGDYTVNVIDAVSHEDMYANGFDGLRFATVGAGSKTSFRAVTFNNGGLNDINYTVGTDSYANNEENEAYNGAEISSSKPGNDLVDGLFNSDGEPGATMPGVQTLALSVAANAESGVSALAEESADTGLDEVTNFKLIGVESTEISDAGKTIVNMSRANYANAVYMDTLNKRQGEARFVGSTDHGVWVRLRHDNIGKEDAFRSHNTMVEVGIDQRDVHDYGEFHTGVALDYMNGSLDYHTVDGDGDIERYGIWFYTTYLGNDGQYADLILKYGHLKNDFDFNLDMTGVNVNGDYTNEVASISAEYGWKFSNSYNYYIEPQAQLQYSYVTGADYTTSYGTKVDLDSIHSLIGRIGFRAGKDFNTDTPITAYIRGDVLHEFLGDQDIRAYDNTGVMDITYENDDTWYTVGLGMTVKSSDNTYFFIEGETALGADNEDTYTVSGGFRHSF